MALHLTQLGQQKHLSAPQVIGRLVTPWWESGDFVLGGSLNDYMQLAIPFVSIAFWKSMVL